MSQRDAESPFCSWQIRYLLSPRFYNHGVGVVDERAAVEVARDFPASETGQTKKQFHLVFVNPTDRRFRFVNFGDIACRIEQFELVRGMEQLFNRILLMRVVVADRQTGDRMRLLHFEIAHAVGRGDEGCAREKGVKGKETSGLEMFATAIEA